MKKSIIQFLILPLILLFCFTFNSQQRGEEVAGKAALLNGIGAEKAKVNQVIDQLSVMDSSNSKNINILEVKDTVKISGRVNDPGGLPIENITIAVTVEETGESLGIVTTDIYGEYEIEVRKEKSYWISAEPGSVIQIGNVWLPSTWMQQNRIIDLSDITNVNFILEPAGTIWLKSFSPEGNLMYHQDFFDPSCFGVFHIDALPYGADIHSQKGSLTPVFWGWEEGADKNPAVMLIPAGMKLKILGLWEIPNFGSVILEADNVGEGYTVNQSELITLDMVSEFAQTELRKLEDLYNKYVLEGYILSPEVYVLTTIARTMLDEARYSTEEELSPQGAYKSLARTLKAKELLAWEVAEQDIEKYRKLDVKIVVADKKGKRIPNFTIQYAQKSHDFAFCGGTVGGWYFDYFDYKKVLKACSKAGFEYMHIELTWNLLADDVSDRDWLYYEISDAGLKSLVADGGLIWLGGFLPELNKGLNFKKFVTLAQKFLYDIVLHYKNEIWLWNIFNEPEQAVWLNKEINQISNLNETKLISLLANLYKAGKRADPWSTLYFNLGWIAWPAFNPRTIPISSIPYGLKLDEKLRKKGIEYDALGLEIYYGTASPPIDMLRLNQILNYYSLTGRPYFISEVWLPSGPLKKSDKKYYNPGCGKIPKWYWHGLSEKTQADYASYLYTLAFSKPECLGIIWLATWDDPNNSIANVGLFDKHLKPKKAFFKLRNLLREWTTEGNGVGTDNGKFIFKGFAGEYDIQISSPGYKSINANIHVTEGIKNTFRIQLENASQN